MIRLGPVRLALLSLAVGGFAIGTGEFVIVGLLPNVADTFHATIPQTGHMVSAYALGVVVGAPTLTVLCVRLPRKGLLISLMVAFGLGNLASAVATTLDWEIVAGSSPRCRTARSSVLVRWPRRAWWPRGVARPRWP